MSQAPTSRALIIGSGYLGTRVGSVLLSRGLRVVATTTRAERARELSALGLEPALLDLSRPGESKVWERGYDAVVYSPAPGRSGDPRLVFHEGALDCATRLLEAPPPRLRRFVYISSTGVYHQKDGTEVDEESPAEPAEERSRILRQAEDDLLSLHASRGFPLVVLRLGGLYGPGRSPVDWLRRPQMMERIFRGGAQAYMSWVRVEDAASAVVLALEKGCPGETYLVIDDEPVPRGEFYRLAAERAGLPPPVFPSLTEDLGKRCSNRKARAELGFKPAFPTYREGLHDL